ncbi:uncharacterized protein [Henckelia pumila]|uniref:uncharacterized protein n=1 Tax=Henckelia pumila TaxID=405737 RepID=UPI003C6E202F
MILLIISCSYCHQYENCGQSFIKNISYPFRGANGSRTYRILEINFRVARQVLWNSTFLTLLHNKSLNLKLLIFPSIFSNNGTDHGTGTRNLVMTGDRISGQGIDVTSNSSFPVPVDRNMTPALASTTSTTKNVSHDALTIGTSMPWLANNTSCKKRTLSDWKCDDDPYAASVKCYMQKRRLLAERGGAPLSSPSNTEGQRWIMERSGLPLPSQSYKLGPFRLVDRGGGASFPSSRYTRGQRWLVESGVPSNSPLLQLESREDEPLPSPTYSQHLEELRVGEPLLSPLYTQSRRWLAESGMVPSLSPSSQAGPIGNPPPPSPFPRRLGPSPSPLLPRGFAPGPGPRPSPGPGPGPALAPHIQTVDGSRKGISLWEKIAIGISSTVGFAVIILVSFIMIRKYGILLNGAVVTIRSHIMILLQKLRRKTGPEKTNPKVESFLAKNESLDPKRYKYSEIKKITNSFSEKLGTGGYGKVYKGILPSGHLVAVKILKETGSTGEDFINEVASISKTSHVNVVKLLGFCYEGNKRALVYEFMPNKSLDKFICNSGSRATGDQLGWETMYDIAVGVAQGLEYLHSGCNTRIIHFDIKPKNILLDENFWPKIADFGLAQLCKMQQSIISMAGMRGTVGYMAPEVFSRNYGGVSHKSDVYSYGMMVLEMFGARNNVGRGPIQSSESYFPDQIYEREILRPSRNLDATLRDEKEKTKRKMLLVGFWCIQTTPSARPSMSKVVDMLKGSLQSIQIPPKPILFSPVESNTNTSTQEFETLN